MRFLNKIFDKVYCSTIGIVFILPLLLLLSCNIFSATNISANEPKVGTLISEDGYLETENLLIPSDAKIIYFQFFLDMSNEMEVVLDFRWYHEEDLYYTYSGSHTRGVTTATLERNPAMLAKFSSGNYRVEVWFLNTLLTSKSFQIQE